MTTIVVADDHQIVREGLVKLLESRDDFQVVGQASDGLEAVELVLEKNIGSSNSLKLKINST